MEDGIEAVLSALREKKRILIGTHVNPDGDAIGSAAGLAHLALHLGAECRILLEVPLPDSLSWLPLPCPVVFKPKELGNWTPDLVAYVDCGDSGRTGQMEEFFLSGKVPLASWGTPASLNVDHHLGNPLFANINWVDHTKSAASEMIGLMAESAGMKLQGDLGTAIYLGLVSDTGNFTFSNTSSNCMQMAGRIVDQGLDIAEFTSAYENNWTLARLRLWGHLMQEITLHADGAVACSIVTQKLLKEYGLKKPALEGYAAVLRRIKGVKVGVFIREDGPKKCKISLRSMGGAMDMNKVASHFGGGGHAGAAGADIYATPEGAARQLIEKIEELF